MPILPPLKRGDEGLSVKVGFMFIALRETNFYGVDFDGA